MNQKFFSSSQVKLALSLDGFKYKQNNPNFDLRSSLEQYWSSDSWNHLSLIEARATLFCLYKAIEAWQNSPYPVPEREFDLYYRAFHSLYEWITNPKNKKLVVRSSYYRSLKVRSANVPNSQNVSNYVSNYL